MEDEDDQFSPELFEDIATFRKNFVYMKTKDGKYFSIEINAEELTETLSIAARSPKIKNHVLTHENQYGILFGSKDECLMIQHNNFNQDLETVISARLSMIDFSREILLYKAQKICNTVNMKEHLNESTQTQYFTEREKNSTTRKMQLVMRQLNRNITFAPVIKYLIQPNDTKISKEICLSKSFQRQEFLFGKLTVSLNIDEHLKLSNYIDQISTVPMALQKEIMQIVSIQQDLNLKSLVQMTVENQYFNSFEVLFSKYMQIHGEIKTL